MLRAGLGFRQWHSEARSIADASIDSVVGSETMADCCCDHASVVQRAVVRAVVDAPDRLHFLR
jgi:hypothetical protein